MKKVRTDIRSEVAGIVPHDELERTHQADVLDWIDSGADLFRILSPDVPPKHLVSYFMLTDFTTKKMLLVHHKKSNLWLAPGGHVDPNESPKTTVTREALEELSHEAKFLRPDAQFITVTPTINTKKSHTDVSLWYMLKGTPGDTLGWDEREFYDIRWWSMDEILATAIETFDPHMHRFIHKIKATYASETAAA